MENKFNDIRDEWYKKAKTEIHSAEQLKNFANEIFSKVKTSGEPYNDSANGASAIALAAMNMMAYIYGMTAFQMGWVMWQVIDQTLLSEHDCGMRLLNYDDMLYPQYETHFDKLIDGETWEKLQEKVRELYTRHTEDVEKEEAGDKDVFPACEEVAEHWKSIAEGKVPFGYKVVKKR